MTTTSAKKSDDGCRLPLVSHWDHPVQTLDFEPHRFRSTVEHYTRGRLSYPRNLIRRVMSATRLAATGRVLDLGCGPGFLAFAFEPHVREVVGIDPEPAMLDTAREISGQKSMEIDFIEGSSYDLSPSLGAFNLVAMGRCFHWMNRSVTLQRLNDVIAPKGAVALFRDSHPNYFPANQWHPIYQSVLDAYGKADKVHGVFGKDNPEWMPDEVLLHESAFSRIERVAVIQQLHTPLSRIIDRALSMSSTSPEKLGNQVENFVEELKNQLAPFARNNRITEVVEFEALLGMREEPCQRHLSQSEVLPPPIDPAAYI